MSDTPKRRWFHFSIRDIMLATVVVAVCVAWWVDRSRLAKAATESKAEATDSKEKMAKAEKWGDAMLKAYVTTVGENLDLKSKVEQFERVNPPQKLSEKTKAELWEQIQRRFNSGRTYNLPGPPVVPNPEL